MMFIMFGKVNDFFGKLFYPKLFEDYFEMNVIEKTKNKNKKQKTKNKKQKTKNKKQKTKTKKKKKKKIQV